MNSLITEAELKDWLGIKRRTDLEKHLRQNKIPYLYGAGGRIATTTQAINQTLIERHQIHNQPIEFE